MNPEIIPAIIAHNQHELDRQLKTFKGLVKEVQLDIMDGIFVHQKSNWFNFKLQKTFHYQAHLMVENPEQWTEKNYKPFQTIIANIERVKKPKDYIQFVKSKKRKIGFALNPETPLTKIEPYLDDLDLVLILTVHPGKYGSPFLPNVLSKVETLAKIFRNNIELDGGMNPKTIQQGKKAGATSFAVGSYLQKSKNKKRAISYLQKL